MANFVENQEIKTDSDLATVVVQHLVDIMGGTCTITEEIIAAESDPQLSQMLAGLLHLFEDVRFAREQWELITGELKKTNEHLLHEAQQRSKLEDQLRQSQKMEAIGRFAGGVAHDFNNLLTVILGYSTMLVETLPESDPIRQEMIEIKLAGERASNLTKQLLAFSRQQILEPKIVDLNELITNNSKMLERLLTEDISLQIVTTPNLVKIKVDPGQIEQVILNLAVNSRDAMPKGGKLIIETDNITFDETYAEEHLEIKPGNYVMLAVSDTGTGMDKATQTRIFEPFFTTKDKSKGTGLGLATVFGIVQQSHGHIWVYSELNKGTTFKIYIPETTDAASPQIKPVTTAIVGGKETILLVEDEDQVRHLVRDVLQKKGYNVLEAQSPGDALLIGEQSETIALLLTDVVMPRMSGREVAERLLQKRPNLKVLYMSGYTEDVIVHHGVSDATLAFLQKPVLPDALLRKVRQVLDT